MEKRVFGSLLMIVLIFGSMAGYAILYFLEGGEGTEAPFPSPTPPWAGEDKSKVFYFAENVDANIVELTEKYPLQGYTSETNLAVISQELQRLEGIDRVLSARFFNPAEEREEFMLFSAEIIPSLDSNIESVLHALKTRGLLSEPNAGRKVVVKVPPRVSLKSVDRDLNISRDYNFEEPFAVVIASTGARVGDRLKINLYLELAGSELLRETLQGDLVKNISAERTLHLAEFTSGIKGVENSLGFEEQFYYSGFDVNSLKGALESIKGVQGADASLSAAGNSFTASFLPGEKDLNSFKEDINSALGSVSGVSGISFSFDGNSGVLKASALFEEEQGFAAVKPAAESALQDLNSEFALTGPTAFISGSLAFSDANAVKIAETATETLQSYGVEASVWQDAVFETGSFVEADTNKEFFFPDGNREFLIRVEPGTKPGTLKEMQAFFYTVRGEVLEGGVTIR